MSCKSEEQRTNCKKHYLISYNVIQCIGWTYILFKVLNFYINRPEVSLYKAVEYPLIIFQNGALLEVVHACLKLTNSSPVVTFQQVYSRVMIVCAVLMSLVESRATIGLTLLLFAWSITEIIRYSNYAFSLLGGAPYFLVWLRYTTFIILYPIGVTGELLCLFWAAREGMRTRQWCIDFPNKWNVLFYYHYYILFNMSLYPIFFPKLYLHMFSQRRKVLGGQKGKTA